MAELNRPLLLRCKTPKGQHMIECLTGDNNVEDLKAILLSITGIDPNGLRVLVGFPPRELNLRNNFQKLADLLNHQNRETLIIEEIIDNDKRRSRPRTSSTSNQLINSYSDVMQSNSTRDSIPAGVLLRRVVAANNSCLFISVYFALSGGEYNDTIGSALRQIIADTVAADPMTYNEAFLGKQNREYCTWILNEDHWGGAIELSILSKYYGIEIVAIDTQNVRLNRFGEDMSYSQRIFLIYDGIHYDPLMWEPLDNKNPIQTVFPVANETLLSMALEIGNEAKNSRQFTDVQNFTLRCLACNARLRGNSQAQSHALETGHINFGEI
ncbi:ubiquitin thioesterase OTU1-like [Oppia nitens]|uniref:ubiquitin thioesterase OTU1-like n=1 Tax=Oppia nitens TaxID=1686743 RepID=UPI0023DB93ED|nr:ubiquitin thioesterase OTU1-like [Oppia nitens]